MINFNITTELPGLNEYIKFERANKFKAIKLKKQYTDICGLFSKKIKSKIKKDTNYSLIINWTVKNNKKDPDNIYFAVKFILDGMVKAGVLQNDTRRFIGSIHHNISTGEKYNIEVNLIATND
jgi:Holliday junction resolvase RusA-like endonuclease